MGAEGEVSTMKTVDLKKNSLLIETPNDCQVREIVKKFEIVLYVKS